MRRWHSSIIDQCVQTGTYAIVSMIPIVGSPTGENDQSSAYTRIVSSRRQRLDGSDPSNMTSDLATRFAMPSTTVDAEEQALLATAVAASSVNPEGKIARWRNRRLSQSGKSS